MFVDCLNCPLRATAAFRPMSGDELEFIRHTKTGERRIPARVDIMLQGDPDPGIFTLFSGWAFRYLTLQDGGRQILDILLPGDLMGLQSSLTGTLRHSVRALTDVRICNLDSDHFHNLFTVHPALSEALVATLLQEEQRSDTRLLLLGRQHPTERLGFFLLELRERLQRRGQEVSDGFALPLTYHHLADSIGMSRSQVGASLKEMEQRGWATLRDRKVVFQDVKRMKLKCEYTELADPGTRTLI